MCFWVTSVFSIYIYMSLVWLHGWDTQIWPFSVEVSLNPIHSFIHSVSVTYPLNICNNGESLRSTCFPRSSRSIVTCNSGNIIHVRRDCYWLCVLYFHFLLKHSQKRILLCSYHQIVFYPYYSLLTLQWIIIYSVQDVLP